MIPMKFSGFPKYVSRVYYCILLSIDFVYYFLLNNCAPFEKLLLLIAIPAKTLTGLLRLVLKKNSAKVEEGISST